MSGLIILPIFIFYVAVSSFILKILVAKLFPKANVKKTLVLILAVVLMFPFWDLIVLKLIKESYILTHANPIVYEKIKFDKNGKYESLARFDRKYNSDELIKNIPNNKFYNKLFNLVNSHIEFLVLDKDTNETKILKVSPIKDNEYKFEYIENSQAQYQLTHTFDKGLFDIYAITKYKVVEVNSNKLVAQNYSIGLIEFFKYFREEILLFKTGSGGSMLQVKGAGAFSGNTILSELHMLK